MTFETVSRGIAGFIAIAATITLTAEASAQSLGRRWDVTVSAERLFGIYGIDIEAEDGQGDTNSFEPSSTGFGFQPPVGLFDVPRLGVDVFIVDRLSLGGSLGFYSYDPDTNSDDSDEISGFLFAPRVGYVIPFNQKWGFWPRGGFTYVSQEISGPSARDRNQFALSLEGLFYFMPAPNVGFTASPVFDFGLTGEYRPVTTDLDYEERLFGIALGLFVRF
jgi:hypothetical protein